MDNNSNPEIIVVINCVLNVPMIPLSIIGNFLVLVTILTTPPLRSTSAVFLCSLAVSDLLIGLVVQPLYVANGLSNYVSSSLLEARNFLSVFVGGVSLCTITAISVDRFLALRYHMQYPNLMTKKRAMYTSTSLWFLCILLSFLSFWNRTAYFLIIAVAILICVFISSFSYIGIYKVVRQHQSKIQVQEEAVQNLNAEQNRKWKRSRKSAINTFLFYIFLLLCYTPMFISSLIDAVFPTYITKAWVLADTVAFMNSSINPFLYCWRLCELRAAVFKTLRKVKSCK